MINITLEELRNMTATEINKVSAFMMSMYVLRDDTASPISTDQLVGDSQEAFILSETAQNVALVEKCNYGHVVQHPNSTAAVVPPPPAVTAAVSPVIGDSSGAPWDARIHSSSRAVVAGGTWRYKRGISAQEIETVEAELRGIMSAPAIPTVPAVPVVPSVPAVPVVPAIPSVPSVPTVPLSHAPADEDEDVPMGGVISASADEFEPAAPTGMTFPAFMEYLTPLYVNEDITQAQVAVILESYQLPNLSALFNRPDLIPHVQAGIEAILVGASK